jgi:hypothetical protein
VLGGSKGWVGKVSATSTCSCRLCWSSRRDTATLVLVKGALPLADLRIACDAPSTFIADTEGPELIVARLRDAPGRVGAREAAQERIEHGTYSRAGHCRLVQS